ncbi:glucose 1-dehydrogenase [Algiphilus sp.]|uniref:glucose 1-dehydrogenase n=1 Tax=Algiphilus sp. TaxID=1872431 RepID=UPI001CA68FB7|nr:glucose 1-dehydrogenase [Algiphilus sp.]MBY8964405.1 glucose 1-dehydrogenase [Algiphilus acroporae]MCI5063769.1 SDR family oxidoreductase [Algiphilus sp.]MCI5103988.1 SDR family oxidoreductase [Algiphilus sp.]MCK5771443.1 glucose 1-dehydrogenase [Algiphilus sp.]
MSRVQGKRCLVSGAARGIGLAVCERLIEEGAQVMMADVDAASGEAQAQRLGEHAVFQPLDVTRDEQWDSALDAIERRWGGVDVLVNNAGIALMGDIESTTPEQWQRTLEVNLSAVMLGTRKAVARMKGQGGAIVNMASIEGLIGEPLALAYNAAKGGVRLFTKSAAVHCARAGYGIRINCVCPGFIDTEMVRGAVGGLDAEAAGQFQQALMARVPMGRLGQAREIANAVLFVASDEASFMTGADLVVDGGHTAC